LSRLFQQILDHLPQTQCGECGYAACEPYARSLSQGKAACNLCPPGGKQLWRTLLTLCDKTETNPPPHVEAHRLYIDQDACIGCYKCVRACPVDAIIGAPKRLHQINLAACTGCDLCLPVCPVDCIHPLAIPDATEYYRHPRIIYDQRKAAWEKHQAQQTSGEGEASKPRASAKAMATTKLATNQATNRASNLAIGARLKRAIARAKQSGDTQTRRRLERQLRGL